MKISNIRPSVSIDLPAIKAIIDAVELFPSELLDDMFSCEEQHSDSLDFWLSYDDGKPIAVAYCSPEAMTVGTWNLLLIAVHPDHQGNGIGAQLMSFVEAKLASQGARLPLVETSGTDEFARTRAFYARLGYDEEARIREYYKVGLLGCKQNPTVLKDQFDASYGHCNNDKRDHQASGKPVDSMK